jgi:hypothetical protein
MLPEIKIQIQRIEKKNKDKESHTDTKKDRSSQHTSSKHIHLDNALTSKKSTSLPGVHNLEVAPRA